MDEFFKNKDGKYVIMQAPNPPLYVALIFWLVARFTSGEVSMFARIGFSLALIYWAYLEVFYGNAPWRRLLGLFVGIFALRSLYLIVS